ncbi:MAG: CHAP domain-containing protein [Silvanigrellales bacterium]|jgi:hypothetical protein|nr:CHAP domain-containing protein [Silvanigrellales bacterium]
MRAHFRSFFTLATLFTTLGLSPFGSGLSTSGVAGAYASAAAQVTEKAGRELVELPDTDGAGLLPKPPKLEKDGSSTAPDPTKCTTKCVTPFGTLLGSVDGADSLSNCKSTCVRPEYSFLNLKTGEVSVHKEDPKSDELRYIGLTYQCVEYARKWWMKNKGITFGSIDSAYEIIYLEEGENIRTKQKFPLARSVNGTAKRAPQRGDLIIYSPDESREDWKHGHVAVVVGVDVRKGTVDVAEENYDNKRWKKPKAYARRLSLFQEGGLYTLHDLAPGVHSDSTAGRISGWIYPK